MDRRRPFHLPGLPRVRAAHGERGRRPEVRSGNRPRYLAADEREAHLAQLRQAAARGTQARPRATSPQPHQGQLARHHPPAVLHGLRRHQEVRSPGEVAGERRFIGLYTFSAYSSSALEIPIVRRKVRYVLDRAGFPAASHYEKDLIEILETYPRDELFQISKEELFEISMGILHLQERQRVRLFVRRDAYGRFFSCLVFVPRDRYNTQIRRRMQNILQ